MTATTTPANDRSAGSTPPAAPGPKPAPDPGWRTRSEAYQNARERYRPIPAILDHLDVLVLGLALMWSASAGTYAELVQPIQHPDAARQLWFGGVGLALAAYLLWAWFRQRDYHGVKRPGTLAPSPYLIMALICFLSSAALIITALQPLTG